MSTDTVLIELVRDREYRNYSFEANKDTITANAIALQLMSFQKKVFGDSTFYIKDDRLFNYKNDFGKVVKPEYVTIRSSKSQRQANNLMLIAISWYECVPVVYDGDRGQLVEVAPGGSNDYSYSTEVCYLNTIWIDDGGGSGGGTIGSGDPTGGTGGSTGGGGSSWYDGGSDPCAGSTPAAIPRLSTVAPVDGCGSGWTPVPTPIYTSTLPPYIINDLTNPCLNKILIKLSGGTQNTFFKQIYKVFDAASDMQMSFKEGTLTNAYGSCNYIPSSAVGPIADITLDANLLTNCSQEWTAYVFIHEVAHAGMKANIITWDPNSTEHENMITTYLNQMATNLTSAFPNLSVFDAYAMCYTGFNNAIDGDAPNSIFMDIMLKQIRKIQNDYTITTQQLIDRGDQFTELGNQGTRMPCN